MTPPAATAPRRSRWGTLQPAGLLWLTLVWIALWRDLSVANALAGLLVAVVVSLAFPLPRLRTGGRLRPWHLLVLLARWVLDAVVASVEVAVLTLQLRRRPRSAVIAVRLRSESDLVLTLVAQLSTLVPGTLAVAGRRHTHTVYLHVLDLGDETADTFRERTLALEKRVMRAFGLDPAHPSATAPGGRP